MILLVDDRPENLLSLRKVLERWHFDVDTAGSGEEALKKALNRHYALFILDVQMPGMDGFEVAEILSGSNQGRDVPIIFLSAVNTDKKFITKGYYSGGIDYITKPVDPDILLLKVTTFYRIYEQKRTLSEIKKTLSHEVEERKKAEKLLRASNHELQATLESVPEIAFSTKPNGRIEFVNALWHAYSLNGRFPEVQPPGIPIDVFWKKQIKKGEPIEREVCIRKLAGNEYRYHLLRALPVKEKDEIIKWVGTFTDIHEQKLASNLLEQTVAERTSELQQINARLENINNELQQFASVASHDLKEPLRKIQVFSTIMENKIKMRDYGDLLNYIDRILTSSRRLTSLINDLLRFSHLSLDGLFEHTDVSEIIAEILSDLELSVAEKNATVHVGQMPAIQAVPGQLRQVFQNIISNALKFSSKEEPPVIRIEAEPLAEKRIDAPRDEAAVFYRFIISDNGIGFDESYVDRIFTIFQRLNDKEQYEGTGIGLAIAKKIVDKHQGLITASSQPGKGSSFIIILPAGQSGR